ncbi:coiled-coil domain-containing protein 71-like [Scyliorhinus canicula]|uniref:coiled-coil domain-containing protein 71-like n=1 Tax=Scyliorhinus canicula TaxID=7830 RepID=UPI0018F6A297|nr:coiled-coil domain-containing protein 71-like [Scyliorhinus canicula]
MAQPAEGAAVQAWSRMSVVGPRALADALTVFSPLAADPLQCQAQLLSFVRGLREEGSLPTVLRSRDVYGYSSCTCQIPAAGPPPGSPPPAPRTAPARRPNWKGWLRPPAPAVRLGPAKLRRHRYPDRRGPPAGREAPGSAPAPPPGPGPGQRGRSRLQLLRSKVIKVDDSSSDEEVRRKAQKILRVNLSPVIRIRPISYPHS